MAYIVIDNCQKCKYTDCVLVCPVDCFYELDDQLVIHPDECIDCGACEPECPVEAIFSEDEVPAGQEHTIQFNADKSLELAAAGAEPIVDQKEPYPGADERRTFLGF